MDSERGAPRYRGLTNHGGGAFYVPPDSVPSRGKTAMAAGPAGRLISGPPPQPGPAAYYPQMGGRADKPFFGSRRFKYSDILLFVIAALLGVIVIFFMLAVFVISSHHTTLYTLTTRMEEVVNLARNVNDASQVMRRALGERGLHDTGDGARGSISKSTGSEKKKQDSGGWNNWLRDRGADEEAMITDNAARALVQGIRTAVRIMEQVESSRLMEVVSRTADHADQVIAGPETAHILQAIDTAVQHPQAQSVAAQTMDILAHVEDAVLPVVDVLALELRDKLQELMASGDEALSGERFRAMVRELMDVTHKVGTGMRDLVVWYRAGGPSDAAILMGDLVRTSRELLESPAAASLVTVLEGIDWKTTGDRLSDAAHNGAAILRTINEANTVDAGDRLIRAVAMVLEDPGTKRVMALLPGIAANATALLAKPSSQRLIQQSSALMGRVDSVLGEAEQSRTVERAAEFMGTLRLLLGALVDGGLHVELGQPGEEGYTDQQYLDDRHTPKPAHRKKGSLLAGLPHVTGAEPEKTRTERVRVQQQQQQRPARRLVARPGRKKT